MPIKRIEYEVNGCLGVVISVLPEGPNNFKYEVYRVLQGVRTIYINKDAAYQTHGEAATAAALRIKAEMQQIMIDLASI